MPACFRFLVGVVALVLAGWGHAQTCEVWLVQNVEGTFPTRDSACAAGLAHRNGVQSNDYNWGWVQYAWSLTSCTDSGASFQATGSIGFANTTYFMGKDSGPCANPCAAEVGQSKTSNFTVCYSRSAAVDIASCATSMNVVQSGTQACVNGCTRGVNNPSSAWVSQQITSTGLYRISADYATVGIGTSCDTSAPAATPSTPTPECVGSLGTVNGKPYCAGTAANPVGNDKAPAGLPPPSAGNPSAGDKPATGEGSGNTGAGRTPSTGNGGNAGGPAGAASTGGLVVNQNGSGQSTGTVTRPGTGEVQANCGAPGQPKCAIDETGTPKVEKGQYDGAVDAYKTASDENRTKFAGTEDKGFFNGWTSFFFAPPVVACTPIVLPDKAGVSMGSLNPCPVVNGVRTVMAYLWALSALYLCVGMVRRAAAGT